MSIDHAAGEAWSYLQEDERIEYYRVDRLPTLGHISLVLGVCLVIDLLHLLKPRATAGVLLALAEVTMDILGPVQLALRGAPAIRAIKCAQWRLPCV